MEVPLAAQKEFRPPDGAITAIAGRQSEFFRVYAIDLSTATLVDGPLFENTAFLQSFQHSIDVLIG